MNVRVYKYILSFYCYSFLCPLAYAHDQMHAKMSTEENLRVRVPHCAHSSLLPENALYEVLGLTYRRSDLRVLVPTCVQEGADLFGDAWERGADVLAEGLEAEHDLVHDLDVVLAVEVGELAAQNLHCRVVSVVDSATNARKDERNELRVLCYRRPKCPSSC